MDVGNLYHILFFIALASTVFYLLYRITKYAFGLSILFVISILVWIYDSAQLVQGSLYLICPLLLINTVLYVFLHKSNESANVDGKYQVSFRTSRGNFKIENIKRGASVIGSAGSGKTESVVYGFLKHFRKHNFCGVIHDYKDFEITEMAYPLFKDSDIPFKVISFDKIIHRVNPIAPQYLDNEESVNEVSRVLIENLLEQRESGTTGTTKFFNDAAEGLVGRLIWKLKTSYPEFCTLPHLIAVYQHLDTESLIAFLESNTTSRAMADAFISGKDSERQTGYSDTLISLVDRARMARSLNVDLFVSLHCNHSGNPNAKGVEIYVPRYGEHLQESILLAYQLQKGMKQNIGLKSRGVKFADFQVLQETVDHSPTVLVELGFLSNLDEVHYLTEDENVLALALSLLRVLKIEK